MCSSGVFLENSVIVILNVYLCVCVLYYKCALVLCVRKYCGFMLQAALAAPLWTNGEIEKLFYASFGERVVLIQFFFTFFFHFLFSVHRLSFSVRRYYLKGGRELRNLWCVSSVRSASQF